MKRLLILLISLAIAVVACGQEVLKRDLEIRKTAPLLNLNGSGATLQFYNGDVSLTQSSNLLTLSGGNFSLGANSLLGSGSIGATGARLLKGWFTDLEITNLPTVNGGTLASALSLSGYLLKSDTATMLTPYISRGDTALMLQNYALASELGMAEVRIDSIIDVLGDTINIEELLQIDLDTDTIPSMDWVREYVADLDTTYIHARIDSLWTELNDTVVFDTEELGDVAPLLADVEPIFVFRLGSGQTADTAVFNDGAMAGAFYYNGQHTLKITSLRGVLMSGTGTETIGVQVAWSDTLNAVVPTKLNTTDLTVTSMTVGTSDTSFDNDEIESGNWVWCKLSGVSAGNRPSMLILTMSGYKIVEL